jgi:hypothetical protein
MWWGLEMSKKKATELWEMCQVGVRREITV